MTIKQSILEYLVNSDIVGKISKDRIVPNLSEITKEKDSWLDGVFTASNIPLTGYRTKLSYDEYKNNLEKITLSISSTASVLNRIYLSNRVLVEGYNSLYRRVKDRLIFFRNDVSKLLSYACIYIDNGFANQKLSSFVGRIGKYITLPFFIDSIQLYNDSLSINEYSTGDIIFSNVSTINRLPLERDIAVKISSQNNNITYKTNIILNGYTEMNSVYCKANSDVETITITFSKDGVVIYEDKLALSEALFNFDKITCNAINISFSIKNTNTAKPVSFQLDELIIFKDIQFSKYGSFESKSLEIGQSKNLSKISMTYKQNGYNISSINPLLSVSTDQESSNFNPVNINEESDISYFKFKHSNLFLQSELTTTVLGGKTYRTLPILNTQEKLWNMNFKNALVLYGLNKDYSNIGSVPASGRYNNWNKVGNYYITSILNYSNDVYINIGSLKCKINNKEFTGNIKIPIGISTIQVHSKDINFDFGSIFNSSDTANPYNFAYLLSGTPTYGDGLFLKTKEFDISSTRSIELGVPFIPLSENIRDNYGNVYTLSLCSSLNESGTYTIDPYAGRLTVSPFTNVKYISVSYIEAQQNRRPVGVLFNRLLTFTEVNSLILSNDDTLFSFDGNSIDNRYIILPNINQDYSQIIFNLNNDKIYTSVRINLSTDNKYRTPLISDIYLSVK